MSTNENKKLLEATPRDEIEILIREATASVEADLALEDAGWINLSGTTSDPITASERIRNVQLSRLYAVKDPLGKQSIRLWTDYTFGTGMTWTAEDETTQKVLESFWFSRENRDVLSIRGQLKSSDKLLIDGEIFFAIFLAPDGKSQIRRIDPLEITEIVTDPDDIEKVQYYIRSWSDRQGSAHTTVYRDWTNNERNPKPGVSASSQSVVATDDALIYHLPYNTTTQRGNPLLLPALTWLKYYTRFLSSRIAIMLALARFAWRTKVKAGQTVVNAIKAQTSGQVIPAASQIVENMGVDTTPIKTETGAKNAYDDGRQIKLMVSSATGIPEQYYGDISIGNLATAKTVELPMQKMFQSYQSVWGDVYHDINNIVLEYEKVPPDKWYVDMDFPPIVPLDVDLEAKAIQMMVTTFPEFAESPDVLQLAMLTLGVNDPAQAIEQLEQMESRNSPNTALIKALREFRESIKS